MSTEVHGLGLPIPQTWVADHICRFVLPTEPVQLLPGAPRARATNSSVRPNLVVGKYRGVGDGTPQALLDHVNRTRLARDKRFKVLSRAERTLAGAKALVQDSMSQPGAEAPLFQREAVVVDEAGALVMLVLTVSRKEDLDRQGGLLVGDER